MDKEKIKQNKKKAILKLLKQGDGYRTISNKLKVSDRIIKTVKEEFDISSEIKFKETVAEKREINNKYNEALKEIKRLKEQLSLFVAADEYIHYFNPLIIKPKYGGRGEAVAIVNINDWHLEEEVNLAAVNGVNEYNERIAERRVKQLWSSAASLIDMCRTRSKIDTVIMNILGDLMSGWIHEALIATNNTTPPEAALKIFDYLIGGIEFILKEVKPKELIIPCVCGNHSRITKKKFSKIPHKLTYEWLVYNLVARYFTAKKNKIVRFVLPQGDMTYYQVYDYTIRISHGDNIQYHGGIGGVHIPLRKAIDGWNTQKRADINYFGHWHTDLKGEDYRISGSLIGYNEFSIKLKCRYQKPSQAFELIHPRYVTTAPFSIVVD